MTMIHTYHLTDVVWNQRIKTHMPRRPTYSRAIAKSRRPCVRLHAFVPARSFVSVQVCRFPHFCVISPLSTLDLPQPGHERTKETNKQPSTDRVSPTRKVIFTSPFLSTRNHPVEESPIMAPRQRIMTSTRNSASTTTRTEEDSAALAANSTPLIKGIKENIPKRQPVATQTEADNARDRHDYFNLIALVCTMEILGAVHGPL